MESLQKDLSKLESKSSGGLIASSLASVEASIDALERWKASLMAEDDSLFDEDEESRAAAEASDRIKAAAAKLTENSKEWYSAMNKYSKAIDKRFTVDITPVLPVQTSSNPDDEDSHMFFSSEESKNAINNILAMHFVRSGREDIANVFIKESGVNFPQDRLVQFSTLHRVTSAMRQGDLGPAFSWVEDNRAFLDQEGRFYSHLEYHLHRSQYIRLLLSDTYPLPPSLSSSPFGQSTAPMLSNGHAATPARSLQGPHRALAYARAHFGRFYNKHTPEISRLSAAALYLPFERLLSSPYSDLFTSDGQPFPSKITSPPAINPAEELYHAPHLVSLFASEFCRSLNMSKDLPLKVVTDIGGSGALAKIAKVRGMMKERRTEWTTVQELPVEIPLPNEYRYHSVFACPVSKEQATDSNPPMMMPCGHVVAEQSLRRLCKGGQNVRCPYCPLSSAVNQAIRLYF